MIIQPITDTSVVATEPEFAVTNELITKDVLATIVPTLNIPSAAAPVDPTDCLVSIIIELAVTAVVLIVAVPPTSVTVPNELAPAVVVDATFEETILFPAVPKTRLPLVAVISPNVAVNVVPAVTDPAVAAMLPVVAVIPVPAVIVVVAARDVVVVKEPGAVIADGNDQVRVLPEPVTVIWLAVPSVLILPAVGEIAPPESPVRVTTPPVAPEPSAIHVAVVVVLLDSIQAVLLELFTQVCPIR